jgi:phosphatidylinositol kinase/protein kinase (PI-3  family)
VLATSSDVGMIQVVTNAMTACKIQKAQGGALTGALKNSPLVNWIQEQNPNRTCCYSCLMSRIEALTFIAAQDFERAVDNFILSCAGYSVATYVLGVGDRHSDNVRN